jgi:hypothetical protein
VHAGIARGLTQCTAAAAAAAAHLCVAGGGSSRLERAVGAEPDAGLHEPPPYHEADHAQDGPAPCAARLPQHAPAHAPLGHVGLTHTALLRHLLTRRARNALGTATQCTRRNDSPPPPRAARRPPAPPRPSVARWPPRAHPPRASLPPGLPPPPDGAVPPDGGPRAPACTREGRRRKARGGAAAAGREGGGGGGGGECSQAHTRIHTHTHTHTQTYPQRPATKVLGGRWPAMRQHILRSALQVGSMGYRC